MKVADIKIGKRVREDVGSLDELCRSIEEVGLLHPVVVTPDCELVAGQRRVEAFRKLGRKDIPAVVVKNLADALILMKAECDENVCRLDFTPGEAVAMGERLEKMEKPQAAQRKLEGQKSGGRGRKKLTGNLPVSNGRVSEKVAAAVGMKRKTYEKAKAVVKAAKEDPKRFTPVVAKMNTTGNIDKAFKEIKKADHEKDRAAAVAGLGLHPGVRHGDFQKVLADVPDGSVDLIFTDPPYSRESLPLYADLGRFAARILTSGGSLVTYFGQALLPEVLELLLADGLTYRWLICVRHERDCARVGMPKVAVTQKPLLWISKGVPYQSDFVADLIESKQPDKKDHDWQQSEVEAEYLIGKLCPQGGFVVDPFCGSGTTLRVAARLGCRWLGAESDRKRALMASKAVQ